MVTATVNEHPCQLLTKSQVADCLGIHRTTFWRREAEFIAAGLVRRVLPGHPPIVRYTEASLRRLIQGGCRD
jgi:hypothetical protein